MEIDLPREPIHSVKDFFIHIFTITVGILIALGLEQVVIAYHHHGVANEARANIVSEIGDNKRELDFELREAPKLKKQYQQTIDVIEAFLAHKPLKQASMEVNFNRAELSSTSWNTAQSTGALSFLNYGEVKSFSSAYGLQDAVMQQQESVVASAELALSNLSDPAKMSSQDLQGTKQELKRTMAGLLVLGQLETTLRQRYETILSKYHSH